ncbi:uncharacterized protein Z520_12133 [Fonsecaea multimorphosa CBS 102226]|uniref:Uncharacterized protein n=1 Tax=Fonsecaea multimorphosa CBS 102226 TaxID=1442371 RepID=A0A0D2GRH8_9EURO|nr:uncharacterized protein Z520_12133 [Fonsecaea multimorphosa CBS 102226]KIX92140.1 hypothetical protein Z520_12133 [Fonsecaea multimorphosa CBS 102226]OAL17508.1 hypothetical protein AYO22_11543 [Fonsecaea multimorphosa]
MPFPSLRRRTVNEAVQLPEEHKSPSPSPRARSATLPALTPRKSLTSLIGSVRKRGNPSPSSAKPQHDKSQPDVLEQELYADYDASNPDHDPFSAGQSPSTSDKPKRYYRTPSPHPLKTSAASSLSRLSKLSRGTPSSRCSDSSQAGSPPKTFLETLADAIRAPTSLFYKENKIDSKSEDANVCSNKPPSPGKSLSPKKSVRFKPGKSIIEDEPRSSPIDIPRATPSLPPVQLASTPLLQFFGDDHPHLIPTARPPQPRVLNSTINFRQAMAAAQTSITEDKLQEVSSLCTPVSGLPLPLPGATAAVENVFRDANDECDLEIRRAMLQEYDNQFNSKGTGAYQSANIVIDRGYVANDEKVQDLPGGRSTLATAATPGLNLLPKPARNGEILSEPKLSSEISPSELFTGTADTLKDDASELKSDASAAARDGTDSDYSDGESVVIAVSSLRASEDEEKWTENPTHEDIRLRFTHREGYESKDSRDTDSESESNAGSQEDTRIKAAITPLPDSTTESRPIHIPTSGTAGELSPESRKRKKKYQHSTSDDDPYLYVPENFLNNPPWVAELALRCDRPFPENKPRQVSPYFPSRQTKGCERSTSLATMTESEPDGRAFLFPEHAEIEKEVSTEKSGSFKVEPHFWPPLPCVQSTPSPASVPLPLSTRPSTRTHYGLHTDEYESSPFEADGEESNSDGGHVDQCGFDDHTASDKHSLDRSNCAGLSSISQHIPRDTEEEKLARAAEVLRKFASRMASGSSSTHNPTTDMECKSARERTTKIPRLKRLQGRSSEAEIETLDHGKLVRGRSTTVDSGWSAESEISQDSGSGATLKTATSTDLSEGMDEDERCYKGIV